MSSEAEQKSQLDIAEKLQLKWLEHMDNLLENKQITSTDLATLARVLLANGWTLDPKKLPQRLRDKLTSQVSPEELEDDGILSIQRRQA